MELESDRKRKIKDLKLRIFHVRNNWRFIFQSEIIAKYYEQNEVYDEAKFRRHMAEHAELARFCEMDEDEALFIMKYFKLSEIKEKAKEAKQYHVQRKAFIEKYGHIEEVNTRIREDHKDGE